VADCGAGVSLGVRFFFKRDVFSATYYMIYKGEGGEDLQLRLCSAN
jgi:hypothetical protein|tara:strand:+ start:149 stop:286 length:138 start_codon:yes stop_codon:yes gene_type:complete